jgi:hypothetical protein
MKTKRPDLQLRVRILLGRDIAVGPGKADLLEAIFKTNSIAAAAREMGMSYKRAWLLIDTMNRCFAKSPALRHQFVALPSSCDLRERAQRKSAAFCRLANSEVILTPGIAVGRSLRITLLSCIPIISA